MVLVSLLVACSGDTVEVTNSPTPLSSPTPVANTPEAAATAFLNALEERDYATMFGLISPESQAENDAERFTSRYESSFEAATVLSITASPIAMLEEGSQAHAAFQLIWETALVGTLSADMILPLSLLGDKWVVEWSGDLIWPGMGNENSLHMERYTPARANIYDRNGLALASEGIIVTIGVVPGEIRDEHEVLAALTLVTGMPPAEIQERYAGSPPQWWVPITDVPGQVGVDHATLLLNTPGIEAREREGRTYWGAGVAPHVVGWVSLVPAEQFDSYLALGYRGDEWVGVSGIEQWGEEYLAGRHGGTLYLTNQAGVQIAEIASRDAIPSRPVFSTLDRGLQRQVQEILGDRKGAIVVIDVQTGAVLAMASGPHFDPNVFVGPGSGLERTAVLQNPSNPLINRATQGTYPTGSVFKIVTISAALESGGMVPTTSFFCAGYWEGLGSNYRMECWKEEGHGNINLKDALTASCDATFYAVGQALDGIDPNLIPTFGRAYGFGAATGIDVVVEAEGVMPDPAWKLATYNESWWVGDSVNLSIGQGYMLGTPLQVANMMVAVANGGTFYRPYLVDRIGAAGEEYPEIVTQPEAVGTLPVSAENLNTIREALAGVTTSPIGTAYSRFIGMTIPVAGKTGTAQAPGAESLPHSWFAAYAPADAPEIAIVAMMENAGEGSQVAAPIVRQVVEAYYGLPLTPLPPVPEATPTPNDVSP